MLVNLKEVLQDAQQKEYAVGLFNTLNPEMAKGVIRAAEETCSPVIIGTAEILLPYASLEDLSYFLLPMAKKAKVPVVLHFDHGLTEEKVKEAISLGFSSVMYDCSTLGFSENCAKVKEMADYAHARNVTIEAELGHVGNAGCADGGDVYTNPEAADIFATETACDALAVAIGTAHGCYLKKPELRFDILAEIHEKVKAPLVLHGGSGLSDADFVNTIRGGIRKINIFTDIDMLYASTITNLCGTQKGWTAASVDVIKNIQDYAAQKMRLFGSGV